MTTRRALLIAGVALPLGGSLTGCSVRLERDAPRIPGVPTQAPPTDRALLQSAIARLRAVTAAAEGVDGTIAARHHAQLDRLIAVAASDGITAPVTPSPGVAATPAVPSKAAAAALESAQLAPAWLRQVAGADDRHRPMLAAVLASQQGAARTLGGTPLPVRTGLGATDALVVLRRYWVATYAAEQLVARTAPKQRRLLSGLLTTLYAERSRLTGEAGPARPTEPLTFVLPSRAADPTAARNIMGPLLADIVTACASVSSTGSRPASITRLTQLWGDAATLAASWGSPPAPFLGLS